MRFTKTSSTVFGICALLMLAVSAVRAGNGVVTFDPMFFNYPPAADGFSSQGGMFELEPTYGAGENYDYASWNTASSATTALANMQASMSVSNTGGIGRFSVYLPTSGTAAQSESLQAWGQSLIGSSSSSMILGTTPLGWSDELDRNSIATAARSIALRSIRGPRRTTSGRISTRALSALA